MKINSHTLLKRFCDKYKETYDGTEYTVVNWGKECMLLKKKVLEVFIGKGFQNGISLDFIDWCFEKRAQNGGKRLVIGFLPYLIDDFIWERKPNKEDPNFYYDEDGIKRVREGANV